MRLAARSVAWLLPLMLTGCFPHKFWHHQDQPPPPPIEAPAIPMPAPPSSGAKPPVVTVESQPPEPVAEPEKKPAKQPSKRKKQPVAASPQSPAPVPPDTQQASIESAEVSAIGQLSTGDSPDSKQETANTLTSIERRLNGIKRTLSEQEQKTAAQIREFVKQARKALSSGDLDGAQTLARKARILLSELNP